MNIMLFFYKFIFLVVSQDSSVAVDTTDAGYKVGVYIGSSLPFVGLLIVFLLIIRNRYRFKSKK